MNSIFFKLLGTFLRWIITVYLILLVSCALCFIISGISFAIIYDLKSFDEVVDFYFKLRGMESESAMNLLIVIFTENLPFSEAADSVIENITRVAGGKDGISGVSALNEVYKYFSDDGKKSLAEVISDILPELTKVMIANYCIYLLLGLNKPIYLACGKNEPLRWITRYITYTLYGFTGFFCAAAIFDIVSAETGRNADLITTLVGFLCLLLHALSKADVFFTLKFSTSKSVLKGSALNKELANVLKQFFANMSYAVINTVLVWWVCYNLDASLTTDIGVQFKFYTALLIFIFVLFLENHDFRKKRA